MAAQNGASSSRRVRKPMDSGSLPGSAHRAACGMKLPRSRRRSINLALQGGGAHGAFTWGVLDYLLEDGRLCIDGVSGTSAGAMNAVALAHGLLEGGADGAREALTKFWYAVATKMPFTATVNGLSGKGVAVNPAYRGLLYWTKYFAPAYLNPFDINPLRDIIKSQIDFTRLRAHSPVHLFIAATHANSGRLRLFRSHEITADAVLASACLPTLYRAVEIDGEPYWDGGYAANPAIYPLFYECRARDIVLVLLSQLNYVETPNTAQDINARLLEFAFTGTFLREMRMFAYLREYVKRCWLPAGRIQRRILSKNFHIIEAHEHFAGLKPDTRYAANLQFFCELKELGRGCARTWFERHHASVGRHSTVDVSALFY